MAADHRGRTVGLRDLGAGAQRRPGRRAESRSQGATGQGCDPCPGGRSALLGGLVVRVGCAHDRFVASHETQFHENTSERGQLMDIRAAEISSILKEQIKNFGKEAEISEVGQVLSVGDGHCARLRAGPGPGRRDGGIRRRHSRHGAESRRGQCRRRHLRLRPRHQGRAIRSGAPGPSWKCRSARGLLGRVVDALGNPIDGKGPIEAAGKPARRRQGAGASSRAARCTSRCRPG